MLYLDKFFPIVDAIVVRLNDKFAYVGFVQMFHASNLKYFTSHSFRIAHGLIRVFENIEIIFSVILFLKNTELYKLSVPQFYGVVQMRIE